MAWKWCISLRCSRRICGIDFDSLDIALQSRCRRQWGEATISQSCRAEFRRVKKRAVRWPERLDGERDATVFERRHRAAEAIGGQFHRLVVRHARQQVPLLRRAEDHQAAPQIATEAAEFAEVVGRLLADGLVGRRQVVAGRFREQPVQADDFQASVVGLLADFRPFGRRDLVGIRVDRERRDFQAGVAQLGGEGKGLVEGPVLEGFVADGEAHGRARASK